MIKGCKRCLKRKAIHDFESFLTPNPLIVFSISYTVPEKILKIKDIKLSIKFFVKPIFSFFFLVFFNYLRNSIR